MNADEAVQLIAVARAAFPGMSVVEGMGQIWLGTLGDLRYQECAEAVIEYAKESTTIVTVADIRRVAVRARYRAAGEERQAEIASRFQPSSSELVPMPDWFHTTVAQHRERARAARKQAEEAGLPLTFGDAIVLPIDRQPRGSRSPSDGAKW